MAFGPFISRLPFLASSLVAAFVMGLTSATPASAERSSFRIYDADQGLASVGGTCMLQDRAGYMLICSEHGVFAYDGRRFINLGPEQGLRQGGFVDGLALTSTGRVVVEFADELLVSERPSDALHPPSSLSFRSVAHPGISFYDERPHRFAPWNDSLVLLAGNATVSVVMPRVGTPHVEPMPYGPAERGLLDNGKAIFSVRGHLWETFVDGRICAADPGAVRCYGAADGLRDGPWQDVVAGSGGGILARSARSVGSFDPASGRWSVVELPDQGTRYANYTKQLGLFRAPDGGLITQADHGLAILRRDGWHTLSVEDGAPAGDVVSAVTDGTGQLWFQVLGRGLVRWVGYGHWENLQKVDGLSDGIPWQSLRLPGGSLWVSTDTGIDEIIRRGSVLRVGRAFAGPSYALAAGPHGELWSSAGLDGAKIIDPASGSVTKVDVPPVDAIVVGPDGITWIGTESGLYRVDGRSGNAPRPDFAGSPRTPIPDIVSDGTGGVLYLTDGRLRHRRRDGRDVPVTGAWPTGGFGPIALAIGHDGNIWIGGPGGLFRLVISDDRVSSFQAVSSVNTRTNTILAVMVDHRGWVWAGTALGVSVFDGQHWVSVDVDSGMISDDVEQKGIREDPDGSVWIATPEGFSHLLDPAWLFTDRPLEVVVSQARLGTRPVLGPRMPFTEDALSIELGTPNYGAEQSLLFRYRLSGVDAGWVDSASGVVRYAFVPPGKHMLTVLGYDELTHRWSPPAKLLVDVAFPWWRRWWSETIWGLLAAGLAWGVMHLRLHAVLARQAELERHVAEATKALRFQAAHDSLTGLLTRSEIEGRLAAKLASGEIGHEMVIALIDIDHFKRVNDDHGHLGGDDILRALGRLVSESIREDEYAGRYGGEEILLVLDNSDGRGTERVLNLHLAVRHAIFELADAAIRVTCSIGLAWAIPGDDWESLIGRADGALYKAKEGGRDRVIESLRIIQTVSSIADRRSGPVFFPRPKPSTR